jgi:hypothetical protein
MPGSELLHDALIARRKHATSAFHPT